MKFSYFLPTKLSFGYGSLDSIGGEANALGTRALVVTDKVMVKTGITERVTSKLGIDHEVFDNVEPEPKIEVADAVAARVREGRFNLVVGIGGGSSMDMAKVAAGFATNGGSARDYVGNNLFTKKPVPSIMVPTTAGTGAELTVTSMVTVDGHKQWINSPLLLPTVGIVDPELTLSMPKGVTAATGMDALCHNLEAILSTLASPITDSAGLEGIVHVASNLERAYDDGNDRKAREAMSLGALLGGIALQARMVYGHSIGYTLATRYRLAHGVSCGLPLPYVVKNYAIACAPKMRKIATAFGVASGDENPEAIGMAVAKRIVSILKHLQIPTTLKELGVPEGELPALAEECATVYPRPNSPLVLDQKALLGLYRQMWDGSAFE